MRTDTAPIPFANCTVEIDRDALLHNTALFRRLAGPERKLAAVVKSDAYGHGMVEVSRIVLEGGADRLAVFSIEEGLHLRNSGINAPILVLGPPTESRISEAVFADLTLTVASKQIAETVVARAGEGTVHLKIETGTNRQGLRTTELLRTAELLRRGGVRIEGAYTHFADIEDTTDHTFAETQLAAFTERCQTLETAGYKLAIRHTACSAATILFPKTYFDMVRVGISLYGLWPSRETRVTAQAIGRNELDLKPVMRVTSRVSEINDTSAGEFVGYGRTFRTTRRSRIAILPLGYADGYPRALSNRAHVLIRGVRAPIRGRICMNLMMVDVTDIPDAAPGDEAVLLGSQGEETISAELLAESAGTINYEIVTRMAPAAPRVLRPSAARHSPAI